MTDAKQHLVDQINAARASKQTLRIRGGGTKDFYGSLLGEHVVLDTRSHSGIVSYEPSELVVTVKAGTRLSDLEAALAERHQYLAFEPPHYVEADYFAKVGANQHNYTRCSASAATVGGMVASGLSGAARASTGSVRDFVLGVQMVNGAGEVLRFGGTVMKNVAGYDVSRLMCGSMGTLGLITEVSIKVLPVPRAQATLSINCTQQQALDLMSAWRRLPLPINSTAWVPSHATRSGEQQLFVRLRGAVAAVESATKKFVTEHSARVIQGGETGSINAANAEWHAATDQALPFFAPPADDLCLWRLSVPATTPAFDLALPQYVQWQGAQRWLWASASERAALQAICSKAGGHAVLFRSSQAGGEADKAAGAFQAQPEVLTRINQQLKSELDPHGVFNTGRL